MNDKRVSDARLAALIDAYADRAPTHVAPASMARSAVARSERPTLLDRLLRDRRAPAGQGRASSMQPMFKLGAAIAAVIVAVAAVGLATRPSTTAGESSAPATPRLTASVSPSDVADAPPGQAPVEVTGTFTCGRPVRRDTTETVDVGADGGTVTRYRDGAWQVAVEMTDPRLEGTVHHTYESDTYTVGTDDGATVWAATYRIENDEGAWESREYGGTFADGGPIGEPTQVFVGEGGYAGLVAVLMQSQLIDDCRIEVRGVIFDGAPVPQPYLPG